MKKWVATLKNGQKIEENEHSNWNSIKEQINGLELDNDGQIISLPKNFEEYIQGKTASGNMVTGKCEIESRYIGLKKGNNIVKVRVNEKTNNISIEVN